MKDIDFDELDKAVNSLMGMVDTDTGAPAKVDNQQAVDQVDTITVSTPSLSIDTEHVTPSSLPDSDETETSSEIALTSPEEQSTPNSEGETRTERTAPTQSRGRFMDVVRPSGRDAKRPDTSSVISRHGTTLEPIKRIQQDTPIPSDASERSTDDTDQSPTLSNPAIDAYAPKPAEKEESVGEETPPAESSDTLEESTPLTSPFLPDAKVEKRPLGRSADDIPSTMSSNDSMGQLTPEAPTEQTTPDNPSSENAQLPEQPLPPEFDSKLLSIETGEENLPGESSAEASPSQEVVKSVPTFKESTTSTASIPAQAIAATSIPQQYKIQSDTKDAAPVSGIYDTQPIAHPEKSMPGWLIFVAIVGILILGAAGGTAVYYLGLI